MASVFLFMLLNTVVLSGERALTFPFAFHPFSSYLCDEIASLSCDISVVDVTVILTKSIFV